MRTYDKAVINKLIAHCIAATEVYTAAHSSKPMPKGGREEATLEVIKKTKNISSAERTNIFSLFEVYFDCKFPREAVAGKLQYTHGTVFVPLTMDENFPEGEPVICCRTGDNEFSLCTSKKGFFSRCTESTPTAKNTRYATADEIRELFNLEMIYSSNDYFHDMIGRI